MPHHNSVFHTLLKQLPWHVLDRAVQTHDAAEHARRFSFKSQVVAMLYGQVAGAHSLRAIEAGLRSHADKLYHLGAAPVSRSTLADANHDRPVAVFADLLAAMIHKTHGRLQRAMEGLPWGLTHLIDSTGLRLNAASTRWAQFSATVCGAKMHVVYDPDADCPVHAVVSAANVNDITIAQAIQIVPGSTYVFDLGYYHFAWWAALDAENCRFVTRLKKNTRLQIDESRPVSGQAIVSDCVGRLPARLSSTRQNPFQKPLREVQVQIETGKVLRIVTNDLTASAQAIADLYQRRWAIELFFRWVKQTLRITRFLGCSENAVRIQIAMALLAFLALRLAQKAQTAIESPLMFARLVACNLMQMRPLDRLLMQTAKAAPIVRQTTFQWNVPALDHA